MFSIKGGSCLIPRGNLQWGNHWRLFIRRMMKHGWTDKAWNGNLTTIYIYIYVDGILPKGPYPPCLRMADRVLLTEYPRCIQVQSFDMKLHQSKLSWMGLCKRGVTALHKCCNYSSFTQMYSYLLCLFKYKMWLPYSILNGFCLVTLYGITDLGQLLLRLWLDAWWHQAITWTKVDLSSMGSTPEGNFTGNVALYEFENH